MALAQSSLFGSHLSRPGPALGAKASFRPLPATPVSAAPIPSTAVPSTPIRVEPRRADLSPTILRIGERGRGEPMVDLTLAFPGGVLLQAGTMAEAAHILARLNGIDVVILDLDQLPAPQDRVVEAAVRAAGQVPVLVQCSARTEEALVRRCVAAGARCVLPRTAGAAGLVHAVGLLMAGEGMVSMPAGVAASRTPAPVLSKGAGDALARLTQRQRAIFGLLGEGLPNKGIANRLGVSEGTVKVHMRAIMQKLGLRNRTQVAILAKGAAATAGG